MRFETEMMFVQCSIYITVSHFKKHYRDQYSYKFFFTR